MPRLHLAALIAAAFVGAGIDAGAGAPRQSGWSCGVVALVTRVIDGDTLDVAGVGRISLLGIRTPSMGGTLKRPAPFAIEARDKLQSLVFQRWARFECDDTRVETSTLRLAYVMLETGEFVNATMVRSGLARVSTRRGVRRLEELRNAEIDAQTRKRGMWGDHPSVPSESYRLRRGR